MNSRSAAKIRASRHAASKTRLEFRPRPDKKWLLRGTALAGGVLAIAALAPVNRAQADPIIASGPFGSPPGFAQFSGGNGTTASGSLVINLETGVVTQDGTSIGTGFANVGTLNLGYTDNSNVEHPLNVGFDIGVSSGDGVKVFTNDANAVSIIISAESVINANGGGWDALQIEGADSYWDDQGDVSVTNYGQLIGADEYGEGLEIYRSGLANVTVENDNAIVGGETGARISTNGDITVTNNAVIAGLDGNGLEITDAPIHWFADPAVASNTITVNNNAGSVIGAGGDGIQIAGVAPYAAGGGHVIINNSDDADTGIGSLIAGFFSGINIGPDPYGYYGDPTAYANTVAINNDSNSAILGSGFAVPFFVPPEFSGAVIKVQADNYTYVQSPSENGAPANTQIVNDGLISPYWGAQVGVPLTEAGLQYMAGNLLPTLSPEELTSIFNNSSTTDFANNFDGIDVKVGQIKDDFSQVAQYALGSGGSIDDFGNGYGLSAYGGVAQGQAVATFYGYDEAIDQYEGGATWIGNTGVMIGSVNLNGSTYQEKWDTEADTPTTYEITNGNLVQNFGIWAWTNQKDYDYFSYGLIGTGDEATETYVSDPSATNVVIAKTDATSPYDPWYSPFFNVGTVLTGFDVFAGGGYDELFDEPVANNRIENVGLIQNAFDAAHRDVATYFIDSPGDVNSDDDYIPFYGFVNGAYINGGYSDTYGRWNPDDPDNGQGIPNLTAEDTPWVSRTGVLSLVDGGAGDEAWIFGTNFYGNPGYSYLTVDTAFTDGIDGEGDGISDKLFINPYSIGGDGGVAGSTGIVIHQVAFDPTEGDYSGTVVPYDEYNWADSPYGNFGEDNRIPIVIASYDDNEFNIGSGGTPCDYVCKEGDTFFIAKGSDGYVNLNGVGAVEEGFKRTWFLTEEEVGDNPDVYPGDVGFYLRPLDGTVSGQQTVGLINGLQNIFYAGTGVVDDHVYGQHFPTMGSGGADLPADGGYGAGRSDRTGLWAKASGNWVDQSSSISDSILGSIDTGFNQNTYQVLGGADFSPHGERGNGWRLGVYGGYTSSSLDFNNYDASADYKGGTVGAYAAYTQGGFYADAQLNADFLDTTFRSTPALGAGNDVSADATNIGVLANTGYRIDSAWGFYEPIASFSYAHSSLDNISDNNGDTVNFKDGESIRAGVGGRIGTSFGTPGGTKTEVAVLAKVWDEFGDANQVTITDGINSTSYSDGISGVFGEVQASATVYNVLHNWSTFVAGGAKFNSDFTSWDAKAGIRTAF
jgi:outer membrane autotransporter protein